MPKLSIIIPIHNEKPSLRRCIDSILSQTFKDLEIICVDDGSSDGSAGMLQDYIDREPRFHATAFQRRLGTVLARKLALLDAGANTSCSPMRTTCFCPAHARRRSD